MEKQPIKENNIAQITKTIKENDGFLFVKVVAGSSCEQIGEIMENGFVKIKLKAPREKGKANKALILFLSKTLNIPQKNISLENGETQEMKKLKIIL